MPGFLQIGRGLAERLNNRVSGAWVHRLFGDESPLVDSLLRVFLFIRDRQGRLRQLTPNAAQKVYARQRTRRNIILKARQVGMTTYIAARYFLATIMRPGTVTLQVAHSLESAQQIFRIVHRFVEHLDPDVRREVEISRANVRELAFAALDSRYIVDTAGNRNAGRGLTVHNLHASEVALWPGEPQETMAALLAAVAPGGQVDIESTPQGLGGYFHGEWLRARAGEGFTPHFFPWWVEPIYQMELNPGETLEPLREDERLLAKRETLSLEQIKYRRHLRATFGDLAPQEYAETDTDCFLVSGRPVFDAAAIEIRMRELPPPAHTASNGAEMVWLEPERGRSYVVGADVAEGSARGDYSAAVVIDAQTGLQCAELLAHWPIPRFAEELARMGRRYNMALLAVERNNHGHAVLYALEYSHHYPRLYRHRNAFSKPASGTSDAGWPMNAQTKPQAISAFTQMLRDAPAAFASPRLLEQCRSFAYDERGEMAARPGTHDDLVMAAAIAYAVRSCSAGDPQFLSAEL